MVAQMKGITQAFHGFAMHGCAGHSSQVDGIAEGKYEMIERQANLTPGNGRTRCNHPALEVDAGDLLGTKLNTGYHATDGVENVEYLNRARGRGSQEWYKHEIVVAVDQRDLNGGVTFEMVAQATSDCYATESSS